MVPGFKLYIHISIGNWYKYKFSDEKLISSTFNSSKLFNSLLTNIKV